MNQDLISRRQLEKEVEGGEKRQFWWTRAGCHLHSSGTEHCIFESCGQTREGR